MDTKWVIVRSIDCDLVLSFMNMQKIIAFLCFFLVAPIVAFAEINTSLQIGSATLALGDETTIQLTIEGAKDPVDIRYPDVDGLSFRHLGLTSSSSHSSGFGGVTKSVTSLIYSIGLSATKTGNYRIPPFTFVVDGKSYQTKPISLQVVQPEEQKTLKLFIAASKEEIFLNEPLDITLKWFLSESVSDYSLRFPLLDRKDAIQLSLVNTGVAGTSNNLTVQGYSVPFVNTEESLNGEDYTVYQVTFRVYPEITGAFRIPAASVKASVQRGTTLQRDFFDRMVRVPKKVRVFAVSNEKVVTVKPLPVQNKPSSFTGAVGTFDIRVKSSVTKSRVGDPIEISITISGEGRLENIERPLLSDIPELIRQFAVEDSLQPGDIQDGSVTFTDMIRPRNDQVSAIPSIAFSYFDPDREIYVTVKSASVPLTVLPTKQLDTNEIVSFNGGQPEPRESIQTNDTGIYANYSFEDALVSQRANWYWGLLLAFPPIVYLSLRIGVNRQRRNQNDFAFVRSKSAKTVGSKRLKKAKRLINDDQKDFLRELSLALGGYISDRLNLGGAELTVVDIRQLSSESRLPESLVADIIELMEKIDRHRFSGVDIGLDEKQRLLGLVDQRMRALMKSV